jgi:group I intron endonuclease
MKAETKKAIEFLDQYIDKEFSQFPGVYQITYKGNNVCYIGSSYNVYQRLRNHLIQLNSNCHGNRKLQNYWNKFGQDDFKIQILEFCDLDEQIIREQHYFNTLLFAQEAINNNDLRFWDLSFNNSPTADNTSKGFKHGPESLKKMSDSLKEIWQNKEFRNKMLLQRSDPEYRKSRSQILSVALNTEQAKTNITNASRKSRTSELKEKLSKIMNSEEMNKHLSQKSKDLWQQQEYRDKLKMTEEKKGKISDSVKNKWQDQDYIDRVTKAQNDPDTNKRRKETRLKTVSQEDYLNPWFRCVVAKSLIDGSELKFTNLKIANQWLKENKKQTKKGFRCDVKWLLKNSSDEFLGYKWSIVN